MIITAFEPFDGRTTNQSLELLKQINAERKCVLPVSITKIHQAISDLNIKKDDVVVMFGEANRSHISIEKFAYNELSMRIKDNDGNQVNKQFIIEDGQRVFESPFDLTNVTNDAIHISEDPGRYLCNMAYYLVSQLTCKVVFIHVPQDKVEFQLENVEVILNEIKTLSNIR